MTFQRISRAMQTGYSLDSSAQEVLDEGAIAESATPFLCDLANGSLFELSDDAKQAENIATRAINAGPLPSYDP